MFHSPTAHNVLDFAELRALASTVALLILRRSFLEWIPVFHVSDSVLHFMTRETRDKQAYLRLVRLLDEGEE